MVKELVELMQQRKVLLKTLKEREEFPTK